ncbi:phage tail tape measure protein [Thalassospira sp.]|uniref:phage tail tape measure protein n=1 Tax=Thalassospira sp. TaxID=1912094 RepID=UPI001B2395EA|nr:phage tail tape measure protein [Thalassospira sp.]MBO6805762.1 phage tail tape measure protein [Thalassospira sp.]MBO6841376.1 phage tail tape measure protein [Thalassospira sp.]
MADLKLNILMQAADKLSAPFRKIKQSTGDVKNRLAEAAGQVRDLERVSGNLQSFKDLKAAARQNAAALNTAQQRAQQLGQQIASTDKVTRKMRNEFNAARKEVNRLENAQQQISTSTGALRQKLSAAGIDTRKLGDAQRKLKTDLDSARAAADKQAKSLDRARMKTNALANARAKMQKTMQLQANMAIGGAAGMATGGAALAVGGRMASAGIDFDEQMSGVGAIARLDKASEAMTKLRAQAEELGASTSFSASEAAGGMKFLAMAGFEANEILQTMPGMLNLAKAGATDLATTADIASNILSGFGMQASDMDRLGDIMTATFTRSNVDLSMLGETMKYTAPIAKEFGASVEDVAAMSGLLGNVGIQGSQAGTALRAMFSRMSKPPKEALDALDELGISTMDVNGNARNMVDILGDLAKSTEGLGSAQRLAHLTAIAGQEAGAAFATLVEQGGSGEITKFIDVLNNSMGETTRVAQQMGDNAAGDIKSFWSAVEGMNISLTQTNDAPLRSLIQTATGVVRSITGWVKANPELAGGLVKVSAVLSGLIFTGGLLATTVAGLLGPFAMAKFAFTALGIQSGMLGGGLGLVGKGIGLLGTVAKVAFPIVSAGIRAIGMALTANPIGVIVMAIAGAAYLLYEYWGPIKAFFIDLWDGIVQAFGVAWDWISDKLKALAQPVKWLSDALGGLFGSGKETTLTVNNTGPSASETGNAMRNAAKNSVSTVAVAPVAAAIAASPVAAAQADQMAMQPTQNTYSITINAGAGADSDAIAKEVARQIELIERRNQARQRSSLIDRTN